MSSSSSRWYRLGALAFMLVALLVVAEATGLRHKVTFHSIRDHVQGAGTWGVLLFMGAFLVGELLHLPGILFFVTGVAVWGRLRGGLLGGATAVLSVAFTFLLVRGIGGQPLAQPTSPFIEKILARLQSRPNMTVALLRMLFFLTPSITYVLALSPVRFGQMMLGSALGLIPPLTLATFMCERVLHWLHAT